MQYRAIRYRTGEYALVQTDATGKEWRQIVGRDTIAPKLRERLDANRGVLVDALA